MAKNRTGGYGWLRGTYGWLGQHNSLGSPLLLTEDQGWTDYISFSMASGNATSGVLGDVYTAGDPATTQYLHNSGVGLSGVKSDAIDEHFTNTSPNTAVRPKAADFVVLIQIQHQASGGGVIQYIADNDHNGTGTRMGWTFYLTPTTAVFQCNDISNNNHASTYTHAGDRWESNVLTTYRWVADRSTTKMELTWKEAGGSETAATTVASGANLNAVGSIDTAGGLRFLQREDSDAFNTTAILYQWGIAVGSTTVDVTEKP